MSPVGQTEDATVLLLPIVVPVLHVSVMVKKVRFVRVSPERMFPGHVVQRNVEDNFHPLVVVDVHHLLELIHISQMFIDLVVVDRPVAVIAFGVDELLLAIHGRSEPERGGARLSHIVGFVDQALEISTVISVDIRLVRAEIVGGIGIFKTVGHRKINDIVAPIALLGVGRSAHRVRDAALDSRLESQRLFRDRRSSRSARRVQCHLVFRGGW